MSEPPIDPPVMSDGENIQRLEADVERLQGKLTADCAWLENHLAELKKLSAGHGTVGARIENLEVEIVRLQAIVDKLPKTADGVPVVPGLKLFERAPSPWTHEVAILLKGGKPSGPGPLQWLELSTRHYYSTRTAAEAAEEN